MKRTYKFTDIPIAMEHEISEWLADQPTTEFVYEYERTGSGDIVSIFEVKFSDANVALLFDLKFSDLIRRSRY